MTKRPIWGVSACCGLVCFLLALSLLSQGAVQASGMMAVGAMVLFGWAAWLYDHEH